MQFTLERYKAFPYVAWTIVILFALYTYNLTMNLQQQLTELREEKNQIYKPTLPTVQ